ncbi:MAG TPA: hypothetical protein VFU31_15150 [Candidatus Binatia bacterium]|nr:hypothetical protein [Candidatus Binatia bacterium]
MKIPRIWVSAVKEAHGPRGPMPLTAWGWSENDRAEAQRRANETLQRMVRRAEQGLELSRDYPYGSRPLREEIVRELDPQNGNASAVVTRNGYGCLVLNTSQVMFVDIDLPDLTLGQRIARLFQRRAPAESEALDNIKKRLTEISTAAFRIYRTAGGFRLMATDRVFQPGSSESENIMNAVEADPAFVRLCRARESFRARLTPKPWRCGSRNPPNQYPRENDIDEEKFKAWLAAYQQATAQKATCRLIENVGSGWPHQEVAPILKLHDEATRANTGLPLA